MTGNLTIHPALAAAALVTVLVGNSAAAQPTRDEAATQRILDAAQIRIGDLKFPKITEAALGAVARRTGAGACCNIGDTRIQNAVAPIDLMTPRGLSKNDYDPEEGPWEAVYSPPQASCWVISSYERRVTKANGPHLASADAQPANFSYLTEREYQSVQEEMKEVVADLDILDKYKVQFNAKIEEFTKSYAQYSNSISTSHGQVRHVARVRGQGLFNGRSWYSGHITTTETCCPLEIRDESVLRQTLKTWIEETAQKMPPQSEPHWTPWLNRDSPSGTGDFETLRDFLRERPQDVCPEPLKIECRRRPGGQLVTSGTQPNGEVFSCQLQTGGYCYNNRQPPGVSCSDYEVRFECPR